jgi:hypothetical protein
MKSNKFFGALVILLLALIVSTPMTQAQARERANVPFEFSLNQTSMRAGTYEISSPGGQALVVRNLDTGESRLVIESMHVQASQAAGTPNPKLVFHRYGDQYFLAEIWDGQSNRGIALSESKREKEVQLARDTHQPQLVVIAMK